MPAGFKYDLKGQEVERELCNQKTIYRLAGGFNLVDEDVDNGIFIPHLAPLSVDFKTRIAKIVKCVKIYETTEKTATTVKIYKGSLIKVGMHLGDGSGGATVIKIDKGNTDYDTVTLEATMNKVLKVGAVLFEATAEGGTKQKHTANFLNYARVKVEEGATVTAVGQAFEIQEDRLYLPVSGKDKESLGARFMFV